MNLETLSYWLCQFLTSFCVISPAHWPCTWPQKVIGHWVIAQSAPSCANLSKLDRISQLLCRHFVSVQLPVTGFDTLFKALENKWQLCRYAKRIRKRRSVLKSGGGCYFLSFMALLRMFYQIFTSYCKFIMSKAL